MKITNITMNDVLMSCNRFIFIRYDSVWWNRNPLWIVNYFVADTSAFAIPCIPVLFAYSLFVDKLAMYSSSPSVTKFLYLSGFLITSFTADYLICSWWGCSWWGSLKQRRWAIALNSNSTYTNIYHFEIFFFNCFCR